MKDLIESYGLNNLNGNYLIYCKDDNFVRELLYKVALNCTSKYDVMDLMSKCGVDNVRECQRFINLMALDKCKIVLVNADKLTVTASHALLKTLEETPEKVHFLLFTLGTGKLLDTIVSRCQVIKINFNFSYVRQNLKQDTPYIDFIVKYSNGSLTEADKLKNLFVKYQDTVKTYLSLIGKKDIGVLSRHVKDWTYNEIKLLRLFLQAHTLKEFSVTDIRVISLIDKTLELIERALNNNCRASLISIYIACINMEV